MRAISGILDKKANREQRATGDVGEGSVGALGPYSLLCSSDLPRHKAASVRGWSGDDAQSDIGLEVAFVTICSDKSHEIEPTGYPPPQLEVVGVNYGASALTSEPTGRLCGY